MTQPIHSLQQNNGNPEYYSTEFKQLLEDHLPNIKTRYMRTFVPTEEQNMRAEGDFYGLLTEHNIPMDLHWVTMRINGLTSPTDYEGNLATVFIPDASVISGLLQKFRAKKSLA